MGGGVSKEAPATAQKVAPKVAAVTALSPGARAVRASGRASGTERQSLGEGWKSKDDGDDMKTTVGGDGERQARQKGDGGEGPARERAPVAVFRRVTHFATNTVSEAPF